MNAIRSPRQDRLVAHPAQRQGLCHVSTLVQMILAKYGIALDEADVGSTAIDKATSRSKPNQRRLVAAIPAEGQQTFSWFNGSESGV